MQAYYQKNKEKINEYQKKYREKQKTEGEKKMKQLMVESQKFNKQGEQS